MRSNVAYPAPGRRLKHVVSVPVRGRLFCMHLYRQISWHEESDGCTRFSIRHYRCDKCGRTVHVYGPGDDIEQELANKKYSGR